MRPANADTITIGAGRRLHDRSVAIGLIRLPSWQAYLFALVATAATLGVRFALEAPLEGQPTLVMFTIPIMLSAYAGGLGPGLVATGLSYLASSYYLLPPIHSFLVASGAERWQQFFVALAGVVISLANEALHRARRQARSAIRNHQHAEDRASQSQTRLRGLIDGLGPSMFVGLMTPQGVLIECNRPGLLAAGLKPEDVLGKPFEKTHW
jgi:two-component system sensor histidine kinase/response regulator